MRKSLVFKSVLLSVLFSGAVISGAQASNLANQISRIGSSGEISGSHTGTAVEKRASASNTVNDGSGAATSQTPSAQLNSLVDSASKAGNSVNSSSSDGLMAQLGSDKSVVDLSAQTKVLGGESSVEASQPNAVPLSAAAWLFSSALFGFVVVANRRKV